MGTAVRQRVWGLVCAVSLLACVPLVKPWLAMGTIDDVSYTRSAQLLAQTGHIVYNGWATAMLGWQLYLGAVFIKLFGFSFNVTRLSMLPVAVVTAFFSQRSMVRAGLSERNATLATLTLVLSPLFLPLAFSFMSDVPGLMVIVLCFYGCLRVLQASSDRSACLWLAFTAITNAVGGSVRQVAWLGLLVMIPSTLWLLRGRRRVLLWGCLSVGFGLGIMLATMTWFKHQPGAVDESVWVGRLSRNRALNTAVEMARLLFDAPVLLLPMLLPFVPAVRWKKRTAQLTFLCTVGLVSAALLALPRPPDFWLEPAMRDYVTAHGVMDGSYINGSRPVILSTGTRVALTILVLVSIGAVAAVFRQRWSFNQRTETRASAQVLPWSPLFLLIIPFSAAYLGLMISRAGIFMVVDRYLLPLLFFSLVLLARCYEEAVAEKFPRYAFVLLAIVAIYSMAATHDAFAMLRARLDAVRELQARGVPDTQIDGGFEPNMWTQLRVAGTLVPFEGMAGAQRGQSDPDLVCEPELATSMPALHPRYALSFDPNACGGATDIPPVPYREWMGPRDMSIYIVSSREQPIKAGADIIMR